MRTHMPTTLARTGGPGAQPNDAWNAWYSPAGAPPDLSFASSALKGLGRPLSRVPAPAPAVASSFGARVGPELDGAWTRGARSYGRIVFAPDRITGTGVPELAVPPFAIGAHTRPR